MKKGKPVWKPANPLAISETSRKPGYRYRWVDKDDANVQRRLDQGFVFANDINGVPGETSAPSDGIGGAPRRRELVLMALPEEIGQAHDDYVAEQAAFADKGIYDKIRADAQRTVGPSVQTRGRVVIE